MINSIKFTSIQSQTSSQKAGEEDNSYYTEESTLAQASLAASSSTVASNGTLDSGRVYVMTELEYLRKERARKWKNAIFIQNPDALRLLQDIQKKAYYYWSWKGGSADLIRLYCRCIEKTFEVNPQGRIKHNGEWYDTPQGLYKRLILDEIKELPDLPVHQNPCYISQECYPLSLAVIRYLNAEIPLTELLEEPLESEMAIYLLRWTAFKKFNDDFRLLLKEKGNLPKRELTNVVLAALEGRNFEVALELQFLLESETIDNQDAIKLSRALGSYVDEETFRRYKKVVSGCADTIASFCEGVYYHENNVLKQYVQEMLATVEVRSFSTDRMLVNSPSPTLFRSFLQERISYFKRSEPSDLMIACLRHPEEASEYCRILKEVGFIDSEFPDFPALDLLLIEVLQRRLPESVEGLLDFIEKEKSDYQVVTIDAQMVILGNLLTYDESELSSELQEQITHLFKEFPIQERLEVAVQKRNAYAAQYWCQSYTGCKTDLNLMPIFKAIYIKIIPYKERRDFNLFRKAAGLSILEKFYRADYHDEIKACQNPLFLRCIRNYEGNNEQLQELANEIAGENESAASHVGADTSALDEETESSETVLLEFISRIQQYDPPENDGENWINQALKVEGAMPESLLEEQVKELKDHIAKTLDLDIAIAFKDFLNTKDFAQLLIGDASNDEGKEERLLLYFLRNSITSIETVIDLASEDISHETTAFLKTKLAEMKVWGSLIARFRGDEAIAEMNSTYHYGNVRNYAQSQRQYGLSQRQSVKKAVRAMETQENLDLYTLYHILFQGRDFMYRGVRFYRDRAPSFLESYYTEIKGRYAPFLNWMREGLKKAAPEEVKVSKYCVVLYHPKLGRDVPLTRISVLGQPKWSHPSFKIVRKGFYLLAEMFEELLKNPVDSQENIQRFQDLLADYYWLNAQLMITPRGGSQYLLNTMQVLMEKRKLEIGLVTFDALLVDCLALSLPRSVFIEMFPTFFEHGIRPITTA